MCGSLREPIRFGPGLCGRRLIPWTSEKAVQAKFGLPYRPVPLQGVERRRAQGIRTGQADKQVVLIIGCRYRKR
jgi:hypothetical protein